MNLDDYKLCTPETFGGINDELVECVRCGNLDAVNETSEGIWLCDKCYLDWE